MGAERPDGSEGTSSAVAKPASGKGAAAARGPAGQENDTTPEVVDFDALHAALGELPPPPTSSSTIATGAMVGESQGRSNAAYSSVRPHVIPHTRPPAAADLNAPAVIVATDDTVPSGPPQKMTMPLVGAPPFGAVGARPASNPAHPHGPPPFVAESVPLDAQRTLNMAAARPRLRTPTIVVRTRGPSKQQKLLVFMAMLLVFVAGGIAFLIYGKQLGFNIDVGLAQPPRTAVVATAPPGPVPTPAVSAAPSSAAIPSAAASATTPAASATVSAAPSAAPTVSVKKVRPRPPPAPTN